MGSPHIQEKKLGGNLNNHQIVHRKQPIYTNRSSRCGVSISNKKLRLNPNNHQIVLNFSTEENKLTQNDLIGGESRTLSGSSPDPLGFSGSGFQDSGISGFWDFRIRIPRFQDFNFCAFPKPFPRFL